MFHKRHLAVGTYPVQIQSQRNRTSRPFYSIKHHHRQQSKMKSNRMFDLSSPSQNRKSLSSTPKAFYSSEKKSHILEENCNFIPPASLKLSTPRKKSTRKNF